MKRSLAASVRARQAGGALPVLSEIKVRSPKDGDLLRGRAPEDLARAMGGAGIAGLSVVTAGQGFGGSLQLVERVRPVVDVPILRKDFLRAPADLDASVRAGADAVLLTVGVLDDDELLAELHGAARERGLETLVETHDEDELERVAALGLAPDLVGVNNRDILVGETDDGDVSLTERLAERAPEGSLLLSESAISGPADARRARTAGADAVLVGTSILLAPDPVAAIEALVAVGSAA